MKENEFFESEIDPYVEKHPKIACQLRIFNPCLEVGKEGQRVTCDVSISLKFGCTPDLESNHSAPDKLESRTLWIDHNSYI